MPTAIRAVMFDLGGVLVKVDPTRLVRTVSRECGLPAADIERVFHDPALLEPFELGRVSARQYFEQVRTRLRLSWTYERFVEAWNGMLSEDVRRTAWLDRLSRRCTVLVLTNTNILHDQHMRREHSMFRLTHHWIASHEVGLRKPEPEIYELAVRHSGVPPQAMAYFDDLEPNVEAARRLGLAAVQVDGGFDLDRELRRLGLDGS